MGWHVTVQEAKTWLLAEAAKRGVELEVLSTSERQLTLEARGGKPSEVKSSTRAGIGLRVIDGGRTGYASTEELTTDALTWALDEAVANAAITPAAGGVLPHGRTLGRTDLLGEGLSAPLSDKIATAVTFEQAVTTDARVQAMQFGRYLEAEQQVEIGSTAGVDGGYRSGLALLLGGIVMREGESVKQGYHVDPAGDYHQLDPGRTAQTMLERVGRQLGAKPLRTGRRRAVFEPEVVATLLQILSYSLSGKSVSEGKSRLAGRLGERVASPLITLVDDATLPGALGSRPFDSEGTPSARLTLIEDGVLRSFMHNSVTARRTGQPNTGHASRSYASTLDVRPSNLMLLPGTGIDQADGVLVIDLMGVHAGANPISGEVSVQAMGIETVGGESHPVDDFAISFNLFELLERVSAVGDDPEWSTGGSTMINAPSLCVEDVSFAGS
jgi:PmbA protein